MKRRTYMTVKSLLNNHMINNYYNLYILDTKNYYSSCELKFWRHLNFNCYIKTIRISNLSSNTHRIYGVISYYHEFLHMLYKELDIDINKIHNIEELTVFYIEHKHSPFFKINNDDEIYDIYENLYSKKLTRYGIERCFHDIIVNDERFKKFHEFYVNIYNKFFKNVCFRNLRIYWWLEDKDLT